MLCGNAHFSSTLLRLRVFLPKHFKFLCVVRYGNGFVLFSHGCFFILIKYKTKRVFRAGKSQKFSVVRPLCSPSAIHKFWKSIFNVKIVLMKNFLYSPIQNFGGL